MNFKDLTVGTFNRCKDIYRKSFLSKRAKSRNLFAAVLLNVLLSYASLAICQIIFILINSDKYSAALNCDNILPLTRGFLTFATPSVCYLNAIYLLLTLFPFHYKEGKTMQRIYKLAFIIPNALGIIANLCDSIYIQYTGRRTTWDVFNEFSNDGNIGKVIGLEMINSWWLVIIGVMLIIAVYKLYTPATKSFNKPFAHYISVFNRTGRYYIWHTAMLLIVAPLMVIGIRGGIGKTVRPITLSNATAFVTSPDETALVLNTPFTIIRTIGKKPFEQKTYFTDSELESIYTPVKHFEHITPNKKNIAVLIIESFGKEYIGAYNPRLNGSLTPFLDSLIKRSKSYLHSYGNGKKSIDGMPSILSGIPMFIAPFISSSASLNDVSSLAGELDKIGYNSAFFHGAPNGSMGFMAYAKACGFDEYFGMTEYNKSPNHNGMADFDGTWAIWDEPFMQYYAECMNEMKEPFITALFTASSF